MLKKLLSGLSMIALLFTACKKQEVPGTTQSTREIITGTPVEPTAVLSPTLFFVDRSQYFINSAILHQLTNINDAKPVDVKGVLNVGVNNDLGKFIWGKPWAYNTKTNEITTLGSLTSLNKLATSTYSYTSISTQSKNCRSHIRIEPTNTQFYCIGGDWNGCIMRGNLADASNVQEIFSENGISRITSLDIDYKNKYIYFTDAISKSIYRTTLEGKGKIKVANIPLGVSVETGSGTMLRIDPIQNKLFLLTRLNSNELNKRVVLMSVTTLGSNWKKIKEIPDEIGCYFSFDIWPDNKIFYSFYRPSTKTSFVNKMNLDGGEDVTLYTGFDVRNVVFTMFESNN